MDELDKITEELFNNDFRELIEIAGTETDDFCYALEDKAAQAIKDYGWDEVFKSWDKYMRKNCKTPEETLNFVKWFDSYYMLYDYKIPDPYGFLGFIYDKIGFDLSKYDAVDTMDGMSYCLLQKCGLGKGIWFDGYHYTHELYPEIVAAAEKARKERVQNE